MYSWRLTSEFSIKLSSILLFGSIAGISPSANAIEKSIEDYCRHIHQSVQYESAIISTKQFNFNMAEMLDFRLFPDHYIEIQSNRIQVSKNSQDLPTIIFTMKPNVENIPDTYSIEQEAREAFINSLVAQRNIKGLLETASESECMQKAANWNFTNEQLVQYQRAIEKNLQLNELYSADMNLNFSHSAAKQFLNGTVVALPSAEKILQKISELPVGKYNFVFIFHADYSGALYDYSKVIVEEGLFFKKILEKANSIAIFSCYPEAVRRHYSKELELFRQSSVAVFQPELKQIFKKVNGAPWGLLEEFARQVQAAFLNAKQN